MSAEDRWGTILFDASFGGMPLQVLSTSDDMNRALVRHRYPHRNGAKIQDQGSDQRIARCRIMFFGETHDSEFQRFHGLVHQVEPQIFTHPLYGSFLAKVGDLHAESSAETRDCIMVDAVFEEDTLEPAVFEVGAGSPVMAGSEEVEVTTAELDQAFADTGLEDDTHLSADAFSIAQAWATDASKTTRDVANELTALTDRIEAANEFYGVATDLDRYPLMKALTNLRGSLVRASKVFAQRSPRILNITVAVAAPLLIVARDIYGAAQAQTRYDQLLELNDIRNPARIEAGTPLRAQSPAAPRPRLRAPF